MTAKELCDRAREKCAEALRDAEVESDRRRNTREPAIATLLLKALDVVEAANRLPAIHVTAELETSLSRYENAEKEMA